MTSDIGALVLQEQLRQLRYSKQQVERAITQVSDEELHKKIGVADNSIAVTMKHMAGNMRSRWTDFLTTDGEKASRERDREFEDEDLSRDDLLALWNEGWRITFEAIEPLTGADLARTVTIRGEPWTVAGAIERQVAHYAYHVGQIVMAARQFKGDAWESLSVPKGESAAFNAKKGFVPS